MTEKKKKNMFTDMILSSLAGVCAVCITNPIDLTKTRLQLDGELAKKGQDSLYKGWVDCIKKNYQAGGVRSLNQGLAFAVVREAVLNCFRLGLYGPLVVAFSPVSNTTENEKTPVWATMAAGSFSGLIGGVLANPVEILKVRMQSSSLNGVAASGFQHGYKNPFHAIKMFWKNEGFWGMWGGLDASAARIMLGSGVQLPSYYFTKNMLANRGFNPDAPSTHIASSVSSAAVAVASINPLDVCRTRLYNQPFEGAKGKWYSNGLDAAKKIYSAEGPTAFYKGAFTHFMRLGPHLTLLFVFLEQFRLVARKYELS